jgi:glycogen phosphorylase
MGDLQLREAAERLSQKIKHNIITSSGHTMMGATPDEFYQAFCLAIREEIMINWMATLDTIKTKKVRVAHYFSMEYLPGRLTYNNCANIGGTDLIRLTLSLMDRNLEELVSLEPDPGLGNGGLGRLASCLLDSLATHHYPARGYGLRYQYGIFEQEIWNGRQVERPDTWLLNLNPWEVRRDAFATLVHFGGKATPAKNILGEETYLLEGGDEVRALPHDLPIVGYSVDAPFSVIPLRLWSTKESPRNFQLQRYNSGLLGQAAENVSLTDVLYPNDKTEMGQRLRLKQEFLLVSASLRDILRRHFSVYGDMTQFADKVRIQINDTHPALTIAELVRTLTKNYDFSWEKAVQIVQEVCSYTNHTVLKEALEEWDEEPFQELLPRQHLIIRRLNQDFCNQVRSIYPEDEAKVQRVSILERGKVRMANLAIVGSHLVNGVARLHGEILKNIVFKDFADLFPDRFTYITNGVTPRRWLHQANPLLSAFISKRIGREWVTDFPQIGKLHPFADDEESQREFLAIKRANKEALIRFLAMENSIRGKEGQILSHTRTVSPTYLFSSQVKRFHEYKRQQLHALYLLMRVFEIQENPEAYVVPRCIVFGGKAAAGYERAKEIITLLFALARWIEKDPVLREKLAIVFVENYNVSKAELIIPATDLSEQISVAGWEASGTGNMKFAMNGALTIGTEDGANIEMREAITDAWWPFGFGAAADENRLPFHPREVYDTDPQIRRALDALKDGTLAESAEEAVAFGNIFHSLVDFGTFRELKDLRSYYEAQKKVDELFSRPLDWAKVAIHNIAGMGPFSMDESARHYAENWGITPCPIDPAIYAKVREVYSQHDRCRIVNQA